MSAKTTNPNLPEPAPTTRDSTPIWDLVIADMRERDYTGRAKYGTPLQAGNGRDALVDAYQEALDLAVYLRQAMAERCSPPSVQAVTRLQLDLMRHAVGIRNIPVVRRNYYCTTVDGCDRDAWEDLARQGLAAVEPDNRNVYRLTKAGLRLLDVAVVP